MICPAFCYQMPYLISHYICFLFTELSCDTIRFLHVSLSVLSRTMKSHSNLSLSNFLQVQKTAGYLTAQNMSCSNGSVFKTRSNVKLLVSWQLKTPILSKFVTWELGISPNNNNNRIQRHYSRFFTISSQRRKLSPTHTHKCHVTCHLVRRDSSAIKFDRVEITFI